MASKQEEKVEEFTDKLAKAQSDTIPTKELITILDDLHGEAGFGENIDAFVKAGGIAVLVNFAVTGWPANGRVADSPHPYDTIVTCPELDDLHGETFQEVQILGLRPKNNDHYWRSPRRLAITALADMTNYTPYVKAMDAAGFFEPRHLPAMLEQSMALVDYSLHNRGVLFEAAKDQAQHIAVRLLCIAGNASVRHPALCHYLATNTALTLARLFKDPQTLWMEQKRAERVKLRRSRTAQGWDEERIDEAVYKLREQQYQLGIKTDFGCKEDFAECGGIVYYAVRFFGIMCEASSQDQLITLIHQGELTDKLKGCMRPSGNGPLAWGPQPTVFKLTEVWTQKARGLSRELYKQIEAEEAASLQLRQSGNTAFKEGRLSEALALYYQAASHNPQDHALFNNISLTALRNGDPHQAMIAALDSIEIDPAVAKSWCRLGDAYRGCGRWQLAHLAYSCAQELSPRDADIQTRKDEARSHLLEVWDIDQVPDAIQDKLTGRKVVAWLKLDKHKVDPRPTGVDAFLKNLDLYDSVLGKREGESRVIACMDLKSKIQAARALAVARGLISPAQLPPSCRHLKTPAQVPMSWDCMQWSVSWTDTPLRHKRTGLIKHQTTVMSPDGTTKASTQVLGTPGLAAIKQQLLQAITAPIHGPPGRPPTVFLAHRLFPLFDKLAEMCEQLGMRCVAETRAEAKKSAAMHDTDWQGYNCADSYVDADESWNLMQCTSDPDNGHLPDADTAGDAGNDTRQARDSTDKQPGQAQKSSSRAAGGTAGRSSRGSAQRTRPSGVKVKGK